MRELNNLDIHMFAGGASEQSKQNAGAFGTILGVMGASTGAFIGAVAYASLEGAAKGGAIGAVAGVLSIPVAYWASSLPDNIAYGVGSLYSALGVI